MGTSTKTKIVDLEPACNAWAAMVEFLIEDPKSENDGEQQEEDGGKVRRTRKQADKRRKMPFGSGGKMGRKKSKREVSDDDSDILREGCDAAVEGCETLTGVAETARTFFNYPGTPGTSPSKMKGHRMSPIMVDTHSACSEGSASSVSEPGSTPTAISPLEDVARGVGDFLHLMGCTGAATPRGGERDNNKADFSFEVLTVGSLDNEEVGATRATPTKREPFLQMISPVKLLGSSRKSRSPPASSLNNSVLAADSSPPTQNGGSSSRCATHGCNALNEANDVLGDLLASKCNVDTTTSKSPAKGKNAASRFFKRIGRSFKFGKKKKHETESIPVTALKPVPTPAYAEGLSFPALNTSTFSESLLSLIASAWSDGPDNATLAHQNKAMADQGSDTLAWDDDGSFLTDSLASHTASQASLLKMKHMLRDFANKDAATFIQEFQETLQCMGVPDDDRERICAKLGEALSKRKSAMDTSVEVAALPGTTEDLQAAQAVPTTYHVVYEPTGLHRVDKAKRTFPLKSLSKIFSFNKKAHPSSGHGNVAVRQSYSAFGPSQLTPSSKGMPACKVEWGTPATSHSPSTDVTKSTERQPPSPFQYSTGKKVVKRSTRQQDSFPPSYIQVADGGPSSTYSENQFKEFEGIVSKHAKDDNWDAFGAKAVSSLDSALDYNHLGCHQFHEGDESPFATPEKKNTQVVAYW